MNPRSTLQSYCLTFAIVVLTSACPAGHAASQTATQGQNAAGEIATGDHAIADSEIRSRILAIFHELDGLDTVSVTVRSGVVTLHGKVTEAPLAARAEELAARVEGVVAITNQLEEETSVSERLVPVYERLETRLFQAVSYFPLFIVAFIFWIIISGVGIYLATMDWPWNRIAPNAFIANLVRQFVRILFIVIGAVFALDILGATALIGTLLGAAGIVGLAVGFAVRDTVENYIASILLSLRQPFRPKDFVSIEGFEGYVISLTSRATILMELNGNHIRIPNATVFKSSIINYSTNPERRFLFRLGVDSDSDLDRALAIGIEAVAALGFVLKTPAADGWIEELGDSSVILTFVGWINQNETSFQKARSEAMRLVKRALESNGFLLPEPIYRLRFDDGALPTERLSPSATRGAETPQQTVERARAESAVPGDTAAEHEIERRVEKERDATGRGDLLDEDAPNEYGKS
jgi:small-conductance mechanosensitive channel